MLTATHTFGRQKCFIQLAPALYWKITFADWPIKVYQAKQNCIIYNAKVIPEEMENTCVVTYKYMCFMTTLPNNTDYQLEESEMILRQLDPQLNNIIKDLPRIA